MSGSAMLGAQAHTSAPAGHPLWHYALVAAAMVLTLVGIKGKEWWRENRGRLSVPSLPLATLAGLGLACTTIHSFVCPEHLREWVVYGVFFMIAAGLQAGWSIAVLFNPSRRLLWAGAVGNAFLIVTYLVSRGVGIPFGPEAFRPENFDTLGSVASGCEFATEILACYLLGFQRGGSLSPARIAAAARHLSPS